MTQKQMWWLALLLAVFGAWKLYAFEHIVRHPPGVLVASVPFQGPTATPPFRLKQFTVTPRASFSIRARVLNIEDYHLDDQSDIMPWDFALGWGQMSDSAVLDRLDITQSGRWYYWEYEGNPPADPGEIARSSANFHLVPSDKNVEKILDGAQQGDIVTLDGELVDLAWSKQWMNTSLTRNDTGAGACEIVYVRRASIAPRPTTTV